MINFIKRTLFLSFLVLMSGCLISNPYVSPPNGGTIVVPTKPIWITGTVDSGAMDISFNEEYPQSTVTEHFQVENAGYLVMFQKGEMSASYGYVLNVTKPFAQTVYTRAVLEDPADPHTPIIYTHYLNPEEKTSSVVHGPLKNIVAGQNYKLSFEFYADKERTQLLERVEQMVTASLDNTAGCIEFSDEARSVYMKGTDPQGKPLPSEKVIFPCKKS